jgi:hypothetical protein
MSKKGGECTEKQINIIKWAGVSLNGILSLHPNKNRPSRAFPGSIDCPNKHIEEKEKLR